MFARAISSVDISTSTSWGMFARAISSVEITQIEVAVHKHHQEVIDEARNKGRKDGIGAIINKMVGD